MNRRTRSSRRYVDRRAKHVENLFRRLKLKFPQRPRHVGRKQAPPRKCAPGTVITSKAACESAVANVARMMGQELSKLGSWTLSAKSDFAETVVAGCSYNTDKKQAIFNTCVQVLCTFDLFTIVLIEEYVDRFLIN